MVAPGKKADLILVKGNPMEDLTVLEVCGGGLFEWRPFGTL